MDNSRKNQSEMNRFMDGLKGIIDDCDYDIFIDRWPQCRFTLNDHQTQVYKHLDFDQLKLKFEMEAIKEHPSNMGISGSTVVKFYDDTKQLVISGSLTVIEKVIAYLLKMC